MPSKNEFDAIIRYLRKWNVVPARGASTGGSGEPTITSGTTGQYWRGDKSFQPLNKAAVALGNVDNTSDAAKPLSTAATTALAGKASTSHTHAVADTTGLQAALDAKLAASHAGTGGTAHANAVAAGAAGFMTGADKTKLDGVATGATANATDANLRDRTTHTGAQAISTVTGLQAALDAKQAVLVSGTSIKTINGSSLLGSGDLTVSASDPSYTPGSFTVATGAAKVMGVRLELTTTQRATITGTGRILIL